MDHAAQLSSARSALSAARHAVDPIENGLLDRDDLVKQIQALIASIEFLLTAQDQQRETLTERLTRRIQPRGATSSTPSMPATELVN